MAYRIFEIENRDASEQRAVSDKCSSYVSLFAKYCTGITWSDLNYKSFTFTPTSGTSSEPERTVLHFFPGTPEQRCGRGAVKS